MGGSADGGGSGGFRKQFSSEDLQKLLGLVVGALGDAVALKDILSKRNAPADEDEKSEHGEKEGGSSTKSRDERKTKANPELRNPLLATFNALRTFFDEKTAFAMTIEIAEETLSVAIDEAREMKRAGTSL